MSDSGAAPFSLPGYQYLGELGRGGMGVVHRARDLALKRDVAIKMVLTGVHAGDTDRLRFRSEAEALARLRHPHIVQIHSFGEHQSVPYFVLEYIEGGNLAQKINGGVQQPVDAARLVMLLARAVHAAHKQGIIHRDLKPSNVLLASPSDEESLNCAYGCPKIGDFGLARRMDDTGSNTASGAILGSPGYMAPEQASGNTRLIGPATDVHALGIMLYEMLTGVPPFRGGNVMETLDLVRHFTPPLPTLIRAGVPSALEAVCVRCLHKDPGRRYQSCLELAEDLNRWLQGTGVTAATATVREVPTTPPVSDATAALPTRRRRRIVPFVVVVLALVALALVVRRPWQSPPRTEPDDPPADSAPDLTFAKDREVAEWILSRPPCEGQMLVMKDGSHRTVRSLAELPKESFQLFWVSLKGKHVTDADLERLADLKALNRLILTEARVNGSGFRHLKNVPNLQILDLNALLIDMEGMKYLSEWKKLVIVRIDQHGGMTPRALAKLQNTTVKSLVLGRGFGSDEHLKALLGTRLRFLQLRGGPTECTARGLKHVAGIETLRELILESTLNRPKIEAVATMTQLESLALENAGLKDGDLDPLVNLASLRVLSLMRNSKLTDKGIQPLTRMTNLELIDLRGSEVTEQGRRSIVDALGRSCDVRIGTPP